MMLPPQTRDLAQRLIANEGAAGNTSEPMEFAAFRVCETLRRPVCALAGVARFSLAPFSCSGAGQGGSSHS
jgi:hypothetical protein